MWLLTLLLIPLAAALYEYRLRRPDHLILYDSNGTIGFRKSRWYPRHFSLSLPGTTHPLELAFEASAAGGMPVIVKIAVTVAAAREGIAALIRTGGWNPGAVPKAAKELESVLHGQVRAYAEKVGLELLSSEALREHLMQRAPLVRQSFGLEIVSLTVHTIDPVDPSIAEALRQRESARLLEQTETLNQNARVAAAQAKMSADDRIMHLEHELAVKKFALSRAEQEQESELARRRVEEELERDRMRLAFDREELNILKDHPHLLLLTPQAARLAEASQSLKNARTVIGLSPGDAEQGAKLMGLFQMLLETSTNNTPKQVTKRNQTKESGA